MKKILFLMLILASFTFGQSRTMKDAKNSSVVALDSAGTFTGSANDVIYNGKWSSLVVDVFVDHDTNFAGAVTSDMDNNTLTVYFGQDGTNWDESRSYAVRDSTGSVVVLPLHHQWFYVAFTNDTVATSTFRIETILYENDMSAGASSASLGYGTNTISTIEVLGDAPCKRVTITNFSSGSTVYVGGDASVTSSNGIPLNYLDAYTILVSNLNKIWLISGSSTDVRYNYEN